MWWGEPGRHTGFTAWGGAGRHTDFTALHFEALEALI